MSELKPCPFCGGKAETNFTAQFWHFTVRCESCGASITKKINPMEIIDTRAVTFEMVQDAMKTVGEAWNRRTE
jgi:Lar family restriction alleviation protein